MTIPVDLMTARTGRPAVTDRSSAARDRGPHDQAFPDALRSAVDRTPGRDRAAQAGASRDMRTSGPDRHRPERDRAAPGPTGPDRATDRRAAGASRGERVGRADNTAGTDAAAQAAMLAALRSNGLSADALRSVAALLGEPNTATDDELVQVVLDTVGAALPVDADAISHTDVDVVAAVTETTPASDTDPDTDPDVDLGAPLAAPVDADPAAGDVSAGLAAVRAGEVQASATHVVIEDALDDVTDTARDASVASRPGTGRGEGQGQGHGPSTTGARGLALAGEVAAEAAPVHHLDAGDADATAPGGHAATPVSSSAERTLAGRNVRAETTEPVRAPVSAVSGEPTPIQGLALGRVVTDRGAHGGASVQRVLDALELLEQAPPPRQITLELGDARVRIGLDDGQVRLSVVGPGNDAVERWLEETRAALARHGFDLGHQAGERTDGQTDGEPPTAPAGDGVTDDTVAAAARDDGGALRL